jgi:integral membrane protein (TIGR01906 family)
MDIHALSVRFKPQQIIWMNLVVLFVVVVPVFLVTTNVRWLINSPLVYEIGFARHDISFNTGIQPNELISAGQQIRDYFNNDEELIQVQIEIRGIKVENLFNEREILHMRDVKNLIKGVYRLQEILGMYLIFSVALCILLNSSTTASVVSRHLGLGGWFTLFLIGVSATALVVGFDRLFIIFHLISFDNDLWILDPQKDYLIAMFPQGFFYEITMSIAGLTVIEALLLVLLHVLTMSWARLRRISKKTG